MELTAKKIAADTHNCRLNTVNVIVCLFNVAIPAIVFVFDTKNKEKANIITYDI